VALFARVASVPMSSKLFPAPEPEAGVDAPPAGRLAAGRLRGVPIALPSADDGLESAAFLVDEALRLEAALRP